MLVNAVDDDDLPHLVHDGTENLDRLSTGDMIVVVACPRCGDPVAIDPVEVARHGQPATIIGPGHLDDVLADRLVGWLGFEILRLGDLAVLEGTDGLSPSIAPLGCPSCHMDLLAVASFGEVQPARWRLVAEGLVPANADDGAAARPPGSTDGPDPAGPGRRGDRPSDARPAADDPATGPDRPADDEHRRWNRLVALVLPMALVVWLHATAWSVWSGARSLITDGEPAVAVIIERDGSAGPGQADGYRLTYRFTGVDRAGRPFEQEATRQLDATTYGASLAGDEIEIRYDPDDPTRSDIAGNDRRSLVVFITVLADVLLVAAAVVIVRSARRTRADQGDGDGMRTTGRVVDQAKERPS